MNSSRMNKYDKRRKNTQAINILLFLGTCLLILLIFIFIFKPKSKKEIYQEKNMNNFQAEEYEEHDTNLQTEEETNNKDKNHDHNEISITEEEEDFSSDYRENVEAISRLSSEDENVISAYTKHWDPIGTNQAEPHITRFEKDTDDWMEMEKAMGIATELDEFITWWIGNDGDQRVVGTITTIDQTDTYRVYLSWVPNEGWQPTRVEILKVNDKHPEFKSTKED